MRRMSGRQPWVLAQKGHNNLSDRWISFKFLQRFPEDVFRRVDMEWLHDYEDVCSVELQYRLKRAITFDPTIARAQSFAAVLRGCFPWVRYGMATRWRGCLVGRTWVSAKKGHNFWSDRWIALKFLLGFPEAVYIRVPIEWLLGDEDVCSVEREYRLKRAIMFDPTIGSLSNFYRCFERLFSLG
jgi:hypothetical protein